MRKFLIHALLALFSVSGSFAAYAQSTDAPVAKTSTKATPADRALAKAVRRALAKTPGFDVSGVFVRARGGAVVLSGSVKSGEQIEQAAQITKSVDGVTSVTNKLALFHGGNG
ncbi:BON domain-containing protein [Caballeronia insecticola]|uniref:Transport-associated n=1 Tax=Caballeronia insecticola TaxID=758793 RepID=R4WUB8_9BURK|nr:BON domain-containing protein [Caballeronia insecticola]BAN28183.1 transport-associated [Caballeronia insecticola]